MHYVNIPGLTNVYFIAPYRGLLRLTEVFALHDFLDIILDPFTLEAWYLKIGHCICILS